MRRAASVLLLILAGCRTAPLLEPNPYAAGETGAARAGAKLFAQHCAPCHGGAGQGGRTAPALQPGVTRRTDAELYEFITNGDVRRGMPSWSRLPDERRWQIVTFLRTLESAEAAQRRAR